MSYHEEGTDLNHIFEKAANDGLGLSYDDFVLMPNFINFHYNEVDTRKWIAGDHLDIPIISSPMDTVTGGELALAMAENGAAGVIHRNMSAHQQAAEAAYLNEMGYRPWCAVSTREEDRKRIDDLISVGCGVLLIDSAQGFSQFQLDTIKYIKDKNDDVVVVAGNVVTGRQASGLIEAGADCIRIGMGPGSICTTQKVMACGRSQATAVYECAKVVHTYSRKTVIADGGIRGIADMVKAFALGADAVMCGKLFADTRESAGWEDAPWKAGTSKPSIENRSKRYRGMASESALKSGGATRYAQGGMVIAQGVEGPWLQYRNAIPVSDKLARYKLGIQQALQDIGSKSLEGLGYRLRAGTLMGERQSPAAQIEGSAHIKL